MYKQARRLTLLPLMSVSEELAKIDEALREDKARHDLAQAQAALRLMQLEHLKTPAAKTLMRDAYLTYRYRQ